MSTSRRENSYYKHKYRELLRTVEDIKTEIQKALDDDKTYDTENAKVQAIALMWCLEVIDKHIDGEKDKIYCDRNLCISNEYNNIGCGECIVNKERDSKY